MARYAPEHLMLVNEREWLRVVVDAARDRGWDTYHTHDSRRSDSGWPDLVIVRPPQIMFVELKTQLGRVSPSQQRWLDALRMCGLEAHVWKPENYRAALDRLDAGGNGGNATNH